MAPILYMIDASPPVRAVLLCAKALKIELELRVVNLMTNEHLEDAFLKMNPQHTVPTLNDDGFYLWDSHAINCYLISKYGRSDDLYPKDDYRLRAVIDQRMHFDTGKLFVFMTNNMIGILRDKFKIIPDDQKYRFEENYALVEKFLEQNKYIAGDRMTLADLSIITTLTTCDILVPIDKEKHPKTMAWIKLMEKLPYYGENTRGLEQFRAILTEKLNA